MTLFRILMNPAVLVHKFTRFLQQRAESFFILRRKPIKVRILLLDISRSIILILWLYARLA